MEVYPLGIDIDNYDGDFVTLMTIIKPLKFELSSRKVILNNCFFTVYYAVRDGISRL